MYGDICERNGIIMGDEMLASVCELAFDVAKEGNAPSAMKNYLYLAQRPPRAYSVAQRALEEDPNFRTRVAERATIENVGEAGYLWLNRPSGWEDRFSDLNAGTEPIDGTSGPETPLAQRPPMPSVPFGGPSSDSTQAPQPAVSMPLHPAPTHQGARDQAPDAQPAADAATPADSPPMQSSSVAPTVRSIEDELSSLRGLVDRLADERQNVRTSVTDLEVELETRRAENLEMSTKLSALRNELTSVQSTEMSVVQERDNAIARVAELEADVDRLTSEVERMAAEAEGSSSEHEAALTDLAAAAADRDTARSERDAIKVDHEAIKADHDAAVTALESMTGERDQLRDENTELSSKLSVAEQARVDLEGQLEEVSEKWRADARQLSVFENVNRQLDEAVTEREALKAQLSGANEALTDLHGRIGTSHDTIRQELDGIESVFNGAPDSVGTDGDAQDADTESASADDSGVHDSEVDDAEATTASETLDDILGDMDSVATADVDLPDVDTMTPDAIGGDAVLDNAAVLDDAAVIETPDLSVDDLGAASFSDDVDLDAATDLDSELERVRGSLADTTDTGTDDDFDGVGIELDSEMLGGRTIGDMFGGTDELPTEEIETPDPNVEPQTYGDGIADIFQTFNEPIPGSAPAQEDSSLDNAAEFITAIDGSNADESNAEEPQTDALDTKAPSEASDVSTPGRRRLTVPDELDDAAYAQHVVDSPDVVLLIDGDGAAGLGWPHLDVATRRAALVDYLGTLTASSGAAADVVFARPVGGEDALPVARAVLVRIADEAVADSSKFASIVNGYPEEFPIAIVTNEQALISQADALQVSVLSNDQLLDLFLDLTSED